MGLASDNPIFANECRRFRRRFGFWALVLLAAWIPVTILTRKPQGLMSWLGLPPPVTTLNYWQAMIIDSLGMIFRADLLVGFFLVYRAASSLAGTHARDEIASTRLTPREVAIGKGLLPWLLLVGLNISGMALIYGPMLFDTAFRVHIYDEPGGGYTLTPRTAGPSAIPLNPVGAPVSLPDVENVPVFDPYSQLPGASSADALSSPALAGPAPFVPVKLAAPAISFNGAIPICILAVIEDLLYATLIVLIALREYFPEANPFTATFRAAAWMVLAGFGILACGWAYFPLLALLPWTLVNTLTRSPGLDALLGNAVWFALALPFEAFLCWRHGRAAMRRINAWMRSED